MTKIATVPVGAVVMAAAMYAAGIIGGSGQPDAAEAFVKFLGTPAAMALFWTRGLEAD